VVVVLDDAVVHTAVDTFLALPDAVHILNAVISK